MKKLLGIADFELKVFVLSDKESSFFTTHQILNYNFYISSDFESTS